MFKVQITDKEIYKVNTKPQKNKMLQLSVTNTDGCATTIAEVYVDDWSQDRIDAYVQRYRELWEKR